MGPYCNYCHTRCFSHWPAETPPAAIDAYTSALGRRIDIIATCLTGQAAEKRKTGWCYSDIQSAIARAQPDRPERIE